MFKFNKSFAAVVMAVACIAASAQDTNNTVGSHARLNRLGGLLP